MHNADVFGRDFVSQFRDFLILIAAQRLQQCCALLFQPYKAKAACLSGQRVYRFDCCITIVPTQGIVQFRAARLVQKSDQEFLQHILVVKPAAGCFKISIYC